MRIGFLYYNCLGFDLFIWLQDDFILNTVAAVVYKRVAFTWSPCSSCTEEKSRKALGRGLVFGTVHIPGHG